MARQRWQLTPAVVGFDGGCQRLMVAMDKGGCWCLMVAMDGSYGDGGR
jgi:hypothetical protein